MPTVKQLSNYNTLSSETQAANGKTMGPGTKWVTSLPGPGFNACPAVQEQRKLNLLGLKLPDGMRVEVGVTIFSPVHRGHLRRFPTRFYNLLE